MIKENKQMINKEKNFTTIRITKVLENQLRKLQYDFECRSKYCVVEKLVEKELKRNEKKGK